MTTKSSSTELN